MSSRTVLCESSIHTLDIFRDIVKNEFRGLGPDGTLSVSYGPNRGLELIPTEIKELTESMNLNINRK